MLCFFEIYKYIFLLRSNLRLLRWPPGLGVYVFSLDCMDTIPTCILSHSFRKGGPM